MEWELFAWDDMRQASLSFRAHGNLDGSSAVKQYLLLSRFRYQEQKLVL